MYSLCKYFTIIVNYKIFYQILHILPFHINVCQKETVLIYNNLKLKIPSMI